VIVWDRSGKGAGEIVLEYLAWGASWQPVYDMEITGKGNVLFSFSAEIIDTTVILEETSLHLLSGMIVSGDFLMTDYNLNLTQNNIGYLRETPAGERSLHTAASGEHYLYSVGTVSLQSGERRSVLILEEEFKARKLQVWDARKGNRTEIIYKILNSSELPLPAGNVRIYENNIYMGGDSLEWTPPGSEGSITAAGISGLRVKKKITEEEQENGRYDKRKFIVTLEMENFTDTDREIIVLDEKSKYGTDFIWDRKPEEQPGNVLRWEVKIFAGKKTVIEYSYIMD
jgi:hypothetical protein